MSGIRRIGAAAILAVTMAAGLTVGAAQVEARGRKDPGDAQAAICAYLLNIIKYPYVNAYIKQLTIQLYLKYECDPALLP